MLRGSDSVQFTGKILPSTYLRIQLSALHSIIFVYNRIIQNHPNRLFVKLCLKLHIYFRKSVKYEVTDNQSILEIKKNEKLKGNYIR